MVVSETQSYPNSRKLQVEVEEETFRIPCTPP